jgi:hypothetical protein
MMDNKEHKKMRLLHMCECVNNEGKENRDSWCVSFFFFV